MLNTLNYDEIDKTLGATPVIDNDQEQLQTNNNYKILQDSLYDVPDEFNDLYQEAYSMPKLFDDLQICSDDEIEEWKKQGSIGIAEIWQRSEKWKSFFPYLTTTEDAAEAINISVLLNRYKKGEQLSDKQLDTLVDYMREMKEIQVRGVSFGGKTLDAVLQGIPYVEEFAIGVATASEGVGFASLAKTLSGIAAKKTARKAVQKAMQEQLTKSTMTGVKKNLSKQQIKNIYDDAFSKMITTKAFSTLGTKEVLKQTGKALPKAVLSSAKFGLTKMPHTFLGNIADRQISSGLYVTDAGQTVFKDSENLALSFMKSIVDTTMESLSETTGFMFKPISSFFAKPIRNVLPKKFFKEFDNLVSSRYGVKATEALMKYGYDGILEELGEEQLNRFLTNVFGSNGIKGYTLDGFLNNVFYFDRENKKGLDGFKTGMKNMLEGYASEALSFAVIGGGARAVTGSSSKLVDKWNEYKRNKEFKKMANYSLSQFYLDQGLVKINGSKSSTEVALREKLLKMGFDNSTIDNYCELASENEMRSKLNELITSENNSIDKEQFNKELEQKQKIRDQYYVQAKNAGFDDVHANANAELMTEAFSKLAKQTGINLDDIISEANINISNLSDDQAVKKFYQDNTSTYKGRVEHNEIKHQSLHNDEKYASLKDFVVDVHKDIHQHKNEKKQIKNKKLSVPADVIVHDKKHSLSPEEWVDIENSIDNMFIAKKIDKANSFSTNNYKVGIKSDNGNYYALTIGINRHDNLICTAIKSTKKGVEAFVDERGKKDKKKSLSMMPSSQPMAPDSENTISVATHSQGSNSIITYLKERLNPNVTSINDNTQIKSVDNRGTFDVKDPNIFYHNNLNSKDDIFQRTDKSRYLTDNEVEQLKKDKQNFENYVQKLINGELSYRTQLRVVEKLPSAYNKIPQLKGKKVVITQDVYKKIIDLPNKFKKNHYIDRLRAIRLPEFLSDPLYILQSTSEGNEHRFVVVTSSKNIKTSEKLSIILDPKKNAVVVSAYDEKINISKEKKNKRVLYSKKEELSKTILTSEVRAIDNSDNIIPHFQTNLNPNVTSFEDIFGYSVNEVTDMIQADVENIIADNYFSEDEFSLEAVKLYGSYSTGKNKKSSDLDFLVQYSGSMSEDYMFNLFAEENLFITDVNGNKIKVDINPIKAEKSGTIEEFLERNKDFVKEDSSNVYFQSAYHGTPHRFDKFSLDAIGTGEGAQVHGWGLYFAEIKDVSEGYRKALIQGGSFGELIKDVKIGNFTLGHVLNRLGYSSYDMSSLLTYTMSGFQKENKEQIINKLNEFVDLWESLPQATEWQKETSQKYKKLIKELERNNIINTKKGQLFEVDIPENDVLLDEDKTFSEQPKLVQKAILKIIDYLYRNQYRYGNIDNLSSALKAIKNGENKIQGKYEITGGVIYNEIADIIGSAKNTSLMLNNRGIKGITYDGRQDGRCYVIFDDKAIDVIKVYYQKNSIFNNLTEKEKEDIFVENYVDQNQILKDEQKLASDIEKHLNGEMNERSKINFGLAPAILQEFGVPNINMIMPQNKYDCSTNRLVVDGDIHNISDDVMKKLPTLLSNPLLIALPTKDSKYKGNTRYVVTVNAKDNDGKLINVIIDYDLNGKRVNIIPSAYGKDNFENYVEKVFDEVKLYNNPIYIDRKNLLSHISRVQFPWGNSKGSINIINYKDDFIKSKVKIYNQEDSNVSDTEKGIRNAKGFTYEKKSFDGSDKENIIVLLQNKADASTLVHEFAHVYLNTLNNLARHNVKAKELLLKVNKWLRYDGKEYTTAQHEKFANGFVAYVKSGKAPSYGLKRVFENFRRWLSDIYNSISISNDVELDDETKNIFDQLLGDMSVDSQIKMSEEIIKKAKENALLKLRNDEESKGTIKFNQLTDAQIRYRDIAYEIIYYALKNSKNEETRNYVTNINQLKMILGADNAKSKSIIKQRERLILLLAETEDAFSANDGFLDAWGEFFYDTGVSYNNQEVGADAELALSALDVILQKKYLNLFDKTDDLEENAVKRSDYEFDYLIYEYKNTKDKSSIMCAFYEWLETSAHPYLEEEYIKKWENLTNEIDRYQSLSKFGQAKEDLKIKAAQIKGFGDYSSQFAEYAREVIKRLDFMSERDKGRIFDKLKDFNSFREVIDNLDDVMDFAETLYDVTERRKIADDIIREVKQTIHEWKDGIKRTKYTYPANKLFERLRELNKLPQDAIKDIYDAQVNEEVAPSYDPDKVHEGDYYETIEKMFIEFKANGSYYNSTAFLQELLSLIQNAKFTAKVSRDEIDFERRMQQINLIDDVAKSVSKHKGKTSKIEKAYRFAFNLDGALSMLFDDNIKQKFSLDYLYAQKDAKVGQDRDIVLNELKKVFGFKGVTADIQLFNTFINMTKKEFKIKQRYSPDIENGVIRETHIDKETGKRFTDKTIDYTKKTLNHNQWQPEELELSRMELLYFYILSMNESTYNILTDMGDENTPPKGQFDKWELEELFAQLTDKEKLMANVLQVASEKYFDELNKYHIEKYHTELGKVKNYFPRKTELEEVKPLELFSDYANYSGVISAQKQRTANVGSRIKPANALAVLFEHIEKSNTLIIMGKQLDLMNRVFKEPNLKKKIEAVWGIDTTKEFYNLIAGNLYSGQANLLSEAENIFGKMFNNVIKAQIFAKPQVGIKQIISFMNYGTGDKYVSSGEWFIEFAKQTFTPKEWKKNIDYMLNIPYLKDRFGRGGSTDALKRQLETRLFSKLSLLDDFFSLPIKVGDMGAIILGGKPYIDILIKKGYTVEEAHKIFIEKTVNEMQSSIPSTLSNLQRNAAKQPLTKMLFAYQNTPWQYFRVAANSIIKFKQEPNRYTGLNTVKLVGLYLYLFPLIFNFASSLSIFTGDEDEFKSDIWKSIVGGITFVPIFGMLVNSIVSGAMGERASTGNWFDTASAKVGNTVRKAENGDLTVVDVFKAVALFGEASTGLPLTSIGTATSGAYDIVTGSPTKGALKLSGYSDYRAKKITGEK